jgi:putative transposase
MSDPGCPTQNALVERFIRTVKEEHIAYSEYDSPVDLRRQLRHYLEVEYTRDRPHSSLNYMTPLEFEQDYYWRQAFFLPT